MERLGRVAPPAAGLLLAGGLLVASRGLDDIVRGGQLGPGFWPRLVLIGLAAACAVKAVGEWRRRPALRRVLEQGAVVDLAPEELTPISRRTLVAALALIGLYVALAPWLGFPLATAGFIVGFMVLAGATSAVGVAANAVIGTVVLLYLFIRLVYLPLPKGAGPVEGFTVALYRALGIF